MIYRFLHLIRPCIFPVFTWFQENAADIYLAAHHLKATHLQKISLGVIKSNFNAVKTTPGWSEIAKIPEALNEILMDTLAIS